ncbi:hypothetical protein [Streptomyces sp. NTK 937]|uniref:hypothetical protein n=1 Tax=Streptomyces sp. NTK 937 TaxID=1487711 RepID=UPI0004A9332B|nr:hypothetical protein [Streptomyces sp. NTK 937]KDQ65740.1 hypothetical protein DT87_00345 [Streptomyces sp. NTK 937]
MTLEEHAAAIEVAIKAAADAGLFLDDGFGRGTRFLELNDVDGRGEPLRWKTLDLPHNPMV